jgi:hypothetical protein
MQTEDNKEGRKGREANRHNSKSFEKIMGRGEGVGDERKDKKVGREMEKLLRRRAEIEMDKEAESEENYDDEEQI